MCRAAIKVKVWRQSVWHLHRALPLPNVFVHGGQNDLPECCLPHTDTHTHPDHLDSPFVFISRIFCLISNEININILSKSSGGRGGGFIKRHLHFAAAVSSSRIRIIELVYCRSKRSGVRANMVMYRKACRWNQRTARLPHFFLRMWNVKI